MTHEYSNEFDGMSGVSEASIRRERDRARQCRKSRWWQQKIGRGECYYCGKTVKPAELTMDHLVPLARGGQSTRGNIVACCKECNSRKQAKLPIEMEERGDKGQ